MRRASAEAPEAATAFLESSRLGMKHRPRGVIGWVRHTLSGSAHLWMWDAVSMMKELQVAGFVDIRRCDYGDSDDPCSLKSRTRAVSSTGAFSSRTGDFSPQAIFWSVTVWLRRWHTRKCVITG
jgi:hypothetical protein